MSKQTIEQRREIEDEALRLGEQRREIHGNVDENRRAISALLETAVAHGISVEHFAQLVGVRRASLYRWRESERESA